MSGTGSFLEGALNHSKKCTRNLQSSFGGVMAPEDDIMELTSMK